MATADEIRARVKTADEARIASRADRAAAVAEVHGRRAAALTELERIEADLTTAVRSATEVMTLDELIAFADVPRTDLPRRPGGSATSVKARSPKVRRRAPKTTPGGDPAAQPVT